MGQLVRTIAVLAVVGAALFWVIRSFYRSATGKDEGCACGRGKCPLKSVREVKEVESRDERS